jgi:hypothetical protein
MTIFRSGDAQSRRAPHGRHRLGGDTAAGALDDLVPRVAVADIFYAGSHGFELRHPDGRERPTDDAAEAAAT